MSQGHTVLDGVSCSEYCKRLAGKDPQRCILFFHVAWWPAHYPSTSSSSTHSGTKRVCLSAALLIKTDFPIRAQNGYSEFSGSCCLRWQSNPSVFQSYSALVKLILHPRPMPKNKALAAIHFKCDNVCVLHISSVSYIFF